jgi:hypothetical protein
VFIETGAQGLPVVINPALLDVVEKALRHAICGSWRFGVQG